MNYLVDVSYDGSGYFGWAKQPNKTTIQGTIESALKAIYKNEIKIIGSGRTDAGVHALHQHFNFKESVANIPCEKLKVILNSLLPNDIRINSIDVVDDNFHALHNIVKKTYEYVINTDENLDLFNNRFVYNYCKPINEKLTNDVVKLFIGEHNFLSFSTSILPNTVRTIYDIQVHHTNKKTWITFTGNGFLRNMVRMLVGAIIDVNENKKTLDDIVFLLNNPSKGKSNTIAPANGLYLKSAEYRFN
ncbi:MAG: tRNA pseudouridine(38-40) synthase TruA [Mycoplasmataceae bacterium]|nr:tRNA pseudouridine(38-40) synthase TruA [Mycoplasmataceae bacterium]